MRFGRDKLAETYRGEPLLHQAVRRLAEVRANVVVVIAPGAEVPPLPEEVPARVVRDAAPFEGPLAGVAAGLAETRTGLALVTGGDMPELQAAVLLEMLRIAEGASVGAVALADGDRFRPLPCVLRTERARAIAQALLDRGERRLRSLLDALRVAVIDEATWTALDPERRTLLDVDTPGDLED